MAKTVELPSVRCCVELMAYLMNVVRRGDMHLSLKLLWLHSNSSLSNFLQRPSAIFFCYFAPDTSIAKYGPPLTANPTSDYPFERTIAGSIMSDRFPGTETGSYIRVPPSSAHQSLSLNRRYISNMLMRGTWASRDLVE